MISKTDVVCGVWCINLRLFIITFVCLYPDRASHLLPVYLKSCLKAISGS